MAAPAILLLLGGVALWWLGQGLDHWNGWTISITNRCGYDVYADNNYDGITIADGATVLWDHASRSHQLTIRLWSSGERAVDGIPALVVVLRGDSMLAGDLCPAR